MFLHFFNWPTGKFELNGLKSTVKKAYLLGSKSEIEFSQSQDTKSGLNTLVLSLPENAPDPDVSVVTLEFWGAIEVDPRIAPLNDGAIVLEPYLVKITSTNNRPVAKIESRDRGCLNNWQDESDTFEWNELAFAASGKYRLDLYAGSARGNALAKEASFVVDVISPESESKTYEISYESHKKSLEMVLGNLIHADAIAGHGENCFLDEVAFK